MRSLAIILFAAGANASANPANTQPASTDKPVVKSIEAAATRTLASSELTITDAKTAEPGPAATDNRAANKQPLDNRATPAYDVQLDKSPLTHVSELLNIMGGGPMSVAPDARALTVTAHGVFTAAQLLEVVAVQLAAQNASVVPQGTGFILALDAVVTAKASGLEVAAVRPGSPYAQMGVQNSDVITQLDGAPVTSLSKLATQMHTKKPLTLEVQRGGRTLPLARAESTTPSNTQ